MIALLLAHPLCLFGAGVLVGLITMAAIGLLALCLACVPRTS